jgi:hypothetical protein
MCRVLDRRSSRRRAEDRQLQAAFSLIRIAHRLARSGGTQVPKSIEERRQFQRSHVGLFDCKTSFFVFRPGEPPQTIRFDFAAVFAPIG